MQISERLILNEIFAQNAAAKRREARLIEQMDFDIEQREQKERREKEDDERLEQGMIASVEQVDAFRGRLDGYDTATVHALMDNERALDAARHRREEMEAAAYRLSDGRRVFKTEDGARVLDRHGAEVSRGVIDPASILDALPSWENLKAAKDSELALVQEREKLHAFQKRLDDTRDAIGKGPVSADALAEMDAALQREMPESLKARMPGARAGPATPDPEKPMPSVPKIAPYAGRINGP